MFKMEPLRTNGQLTATQFDLPPDDFRTLAKLRAQSTAAALNDNTSGAADQPTTAAKLALRRLMMVAWLAILLGLAMEALSLTGRASVGSHPTVMQIMVELTQGITWSFFVCAGVGLGSALGKTRAALGGLIGLISAPLA